MLTCESYGYRIFEDDVAICPRCLGALRALNVDEDEKTPLSLAIADSGHEVDFAKAIAAAIDAANELPLSDEEYATELTRIASIAFFDQSDENGVADTTVTSVKTPAPAMAIPAAQDESEQVEDARRPMLFDRATAQMHALAKEAGARIRQVPMRPRGAGLVAAASIAIVATTVALGVGLTASHRAGGNAAEAPPAAAATALASAATPAGASPAVDTTPAEIPIPSAIELASREMEGPPAPVELPAAAAIIHARSGIRAVELERQIAIKESTGRTIVGELLDVKEGFVHVKTAREHLRIAERNVVDAATF